MALPGGDQHPQRPATAVAGQVDLGGQPAAAAPEAWSLSASVPT
jgi:hypothetical protein